MIRILQLVLVGIVLLCNSPYQARGHNGEMPNEKLLTVINALNQKYRVHFTYDREIIQNVTLPKKVNLDSFTNVNDALSDILSSTKLKYKILDNKYVVIYQADRKGMASLQKMVTMLQDVIDEKTTERAPQSNAVASVANTGSMSLSRKQAMLLDVSGKVVDASGDGIPGVNVTVKGTQQGTITDASGDFEVDVPNENAILVFSFVGYESQEVVVGNQKFIEVKLEEDRKMLEEVVVIGYGTSKKKDLTGAISTIKAENLAAQAPRNVQDLLRANAPGLNIGIATDAKAEASLSVRGQGTLTASNSPLIVLNNVIYEGALSDINPNDIATIDILKDASAAAVYGARSANGVIVITTKKGKKGKPVINFAANTGVSVSANEPRILDEKGFMKFRQDYNEGRNSDAYLAQYPQIFTNPFELNGVNQLDWYNYDQKTPVPSVTNDQLTTQWLSRLNFSTPEMENYFAGKITKWNELVFQRAFEQDYNVSVSNATDHISQYFSLGYTDREGIITGDRYKNLRVRFNIESKITNFLTVGANTQFASRNEGFLRADWGQMTMISPYGSNNIDDLTSNYRRRPTGLDPINPFYDNLYTERVDRRQNVLGTLFTKIKLPFNIEYNMNFSPYYNWYEYYNHNSSQGDNWSAIGGRSTRTHSKRINWQFDNIFTWNKEFNDIHRLSATVLINAEKAQFWQTTANASNYSPNDGLGFHAIQAGAVATVSSEDNYQTGDALMGRLFYSLKDKYMVTASVRRDGYSAFGKKNPRAVFPSIALGWTFSDESFMQNVSWLNYGKLRLSWGENGNREIGQYAALSRMSSSLLPYIDQSGNVYSTSQIYVTSMANHNLKWERSASYNIGVDFRMLNNRISGSLEGYQTRTNDLLVSRALPDITGYTSVMSNLGQIQNTGMELALTGDVIKRSDFSWITTANFSFNRRKINSLYGDMTNVLDANGNIIGTKEADDETNGWFIGQDPNRIWSYRKLGVWQQNEVEEATKYGLQPGDFKYEDVNGDGIMNNQDKVFQGYTTPRFRWSLRNEAKYRNFTLAVMVYSNLGYYAAFQRGANNYSFPDRTSDYDFPRWTATNPINDYARIGSKNIGTNWVNTSFVRLDNITLSYTVPQAVINKLSIQHLQVSMGVKNAGVFAPQWNFWDPESRTVTPRTYNLGLNLTL